MNNVKNVPRPIPICCNNQHTGKIIINDFQFLTNIEIKIYNKLNITNKFQIIVFILFFHHLQGKYTKRISGSQRFSRGKKKEALLLAPL